MFNNSHFWVVCASASIIKFLLLVESHIFLHLLMSHNFWLSSAHCVKKNCSHWNKCYFPQKDPPPLLGKWGADHFGDQVKAIFILKTAANKHQPTKQKRHKAPDLLSGFPFPAWLLLLWLFLWLKSLVWPWPWSLGSWPSAWSPSWPQALLPTFTSHSCLPPPPRPHYSRPPASVNVAPDSSLFFPSHLFWVPHGHFQVLFSFSSSIYFFSKSTHYSVISLSL